MATPTTGSQGTTVPVTRSTPGCVTRSQWSGSGTVQTNLFREPRVGMVEAVRQRVMEQKTRLEDPVEETTSSSESEEDPVVLSSSSSERKYEGTTTPSQPELEDDLESSPPALAHRPITRSTSKKPTSKPKHKAYKTKAAEPSSSSRKKSRG